MNNIQKSFKRKAEASGRCLADGYVPTMVDPNGSNYDALNAERTQRWAADEAAQRARYGLQPAPTTPSLAPVSPLTSAGGQSSTQPEGTTFEQDLTARQGRIDGLRAKLNGMEAAARSSTNTLQAPARFADGKVPVHSGAGVVHGPGGPRDDKVPAMLSNTEAVLPAKTVQALGGPDAVEELIEQTTGREPTKGLRGGGHYYGGGIGDRIDPTELRPEFRSQAQTPVIEPAANAGLEAARNGRAAAVQAAMPSAEAVATQNTYADEVRARAAQNRAAIPTTPAPEFVATAAPPPATKPYDVGLKAAKMYKDVGGITGVAKAAVGGALEAGAKYLVPADAAYSTVAGDDAIRVGTPEEASGGRKFNAKGLADGAKQLALRAGDWGTRGADMLMDLPLQALNAAGATHEGKPLAYGAINSAYREGMRNANIDGAVIPKNVSEREREEAADPYAKFRDQNAVPVTDGRVDLVKINKMPRGVDNAEVAAARRKGKMGEWHEAKAADEANTTEARGLAAAKQFFPNGDMPDNIRYSRQNETNAPMATWSSKGDAAAKTIGSLKDGSYIQPQDGTGIVSIRQKDGSYKNVALGQSDYRGADGSVTHDFSKSERYAQGLRDAKNIRGQLETFQKMNADSDMQSNDPHAQMNGIMVNMGLRADAANRTAIAAANAKNTLAQEQLKLQYSAENRALRAEQNNVARDARDFKAKDDESHTKRLGELIENWAGDPKADGYNQRVAALHAYAGNFKRGSMTSDQHIAELIKNKAYDDYVNRVGQHWFTPQSEQTGQPVMPKREANAGLRSAMEGAFVGKNRFKDANTKQTYYDSDVANMPKELQEIHEQRLAAAMKAK